MLLQWPELSSGVRPLAASTVPMLYKCPVKREARLIYITIIDAILHDAYMPSNLLGYPIRLPAYTKDL